MFLVKLSFIFGVIVSAPIRNSRIRRRIRGKINLFILRPYIRRFMKREYGIKINSLSFVRQQSLNRVVGLVNDKYFVKIFRNISVKRIQDFAELMGIVENSLSVTVPHIVADDKIAMFSYEKIDGVDINEFDKSRIQRDKKRLFTQVQDIIAQLQSINVRRIPQFDRFLTDIYSQKYGNPTVRSTSLTLGHFDVNLGNFLYDKNMNITSVIDWDTIAITDDVDACWGVFMRYWNNRYK